MEHSALPPPADTLRSLAIPIPKGQLLIPRNTINLKPPVATTITSKEHFLSGNTQVLYTPKIQRGNETQEENTTQQTQIQKPAPRSIINPIPDT